MQEMINTSIETEEKPRKISPNNVCYWAEQEGILVGSQKSKAKKFLEKGCVQYQGEGQWKVLPIIGYNKTTHEVDMLNRTCKCQFFRKTGSDCSHIKAVELKIFMDKWNN